MRSAPRRSTRLSLLLLSLLAGGAHASSLPAPQYQGYSSLIVLPSGAAQATYLSSSAGVHPASGNGSATTPVSDSTALSFADAQSSAFYDAEIGALHVAGAAGLSSLGNIELPGHSASASSVTSYTDFVLVQGPTPDAVGTATLLFTLTVDGSLSATQPAANDPYGYSGAAQVTGTLSIIQGSATCQPACGVNYSAAQGSSGAANFYSTSSGPSTVSFLAQVAFGTVLGVYSQLYVNDSVNTYPVGDYSTVSNYQDTGTTNIDVQTAGVSLLSSSGHDYASVVPELPTRSSMAIGLGLGLLALRRRRGPRA